METDPRSPGKRWLIICFTKWWHVFVYNYKYIMTFWDNMYIFCTSCIIQLYLICRFDLGPYSPTAHTRSWSYSSLLKRTSFEAVCLTESFRFFCRRPVNAVCRQQDFLLFCFFFIFVMMGGEPGLSHPVFLHSLQGRRRPAKDGHNGRAEWVSPPTTVYCYTPPAACGSRRQTDPVHEVQHFKEIGGWMWVSNSLYTSRVAYSYILFPLSTVASVDGCCPGSLDA